MLEPAVMSGRIHGVPVHHILHAVIDAMDREADQVVLNDVAARFGLEPEDIRIAVAHGAGCSQYCD
jgi:hypothetical protein